MDVNESFDFDTMVAYAGLAVHTLNNSATEINRKTLKDEMKMLHDKFGTLEVIRLSNTIAKGKK